MSAYQEQIQNELRLEYAAIRERNRRERERVTREVYRSLPRVREIDEALGQIGLGIAAKVLDGAMSPREAVTDMRGRMEALTAEKKLLLKEAGLPEDILQERFDCEACRDKGYADGAHCACRIQKQSRLLQKYSNIKISGQSGFDRFNLKLFSETPSPRYGVSPRENMRSVLELALGYAQNAGGAVRHLLLYGGTGLGKTFTSDCIAKSYIQQGRTVFYLSAPRLFTIFEDYKFGRDTSEDARRAIDSVSSAELLIIDDLGTEFRTAYTDSILFDIINSRIIEEKRMIISTNLSVKDLKHTYSERICSRVLGSFTEVLFFGDDIRLKA